MKYDFNAVHFESAYQLWNKLNYDYYLDHYYIRDRGHVCTYAYAYRYASSFCRNGQVCIGVPVESLLSEYYFENFQFIAI